jgi:4-carboxymuconolactone decarboxylase
MDTNRHDLGTEVLKRIGGANYDAPLVALAEIAPDLARFTVEFAYADVLARDQLDLPTRQIATIAALAAMGNAAPQLQYHIEGALYVGCEPGSIVETLILTTIYAGFPAALNGIRAARETFEKRGVRVTRPSATRDDDRHRRGLQALQSVSGEGGAQVVDSLAEIAPDLARFIIDFSYGDVISRPGLDYRTKELATIALLTALGTARPQLKVHVGAALRVGASRIEIVEVIQLLDPIG